MSIIPLQTKIIFLEDVVIVSFGHRPSLTIEARKEWIRAEIDSLDLFSNLSDDEKNRLIWRSNTIPTLEKAKATLKEAKDRHFRERKLLIQEGDFHSFSFSPLFIFIYL